jgi:hypothetical protein
MTAKEYPVSFAYASTSSPYSRSHHHKGKDYATPMATAVKVGDTTIGYSGNSGSFMGQKYAPHLHIQAGLDDWAQNDIDPTPYAFKPGKVIRVGMADQWGAYVCVRVGNVNVFYCHLSSTNVQIGKEIKPEEVMDMLNDKAQMDRMFWQYRHRSPNESEYSRFLTKYTVGQMEKTLAGGVEHQQTKQAMDLGFKADKDKYQRRLTDAQNSVVSLVKALALNDSTFKSKIKKI